MGADRQSSDAIETSELTDAEVAAAGKLGEALLAGQTPAQRDIAMRIFDRLKAGAEVDEVKDLIGDLSYTATADERRRERERYSR